jgi:hypothetical protein
LGGNPFAPSQSQSQSLSNPFQAAKPPPPTINQLRAQNQFTVPFDSTSSNLNHLQTTLPPQQPLVQLQQTGNNSNVLPQFQTNFPQQTHNPFTQI